MKEGQPREQKQFAKLGRQMRAMERQGIVVPQLLITERMRIDDSLAKRSREWHRNYPSQERSE